MASIDTLVEDISKILRSEGPKLSVDQLGEQLGRMGVNVARSLNKALIRNDASVRSDPKVIYASEFGNKCLRQLFYKHKHPELAEGIHAAARFKFFYGDIVEEAMLALAEVAGHTVEDRQKRIELPATNGYKVTGRIDAVIDGVVVDVKSVSTIGFREFQVGLGGRKFGYADQLALYAMAEKKKDKGHFLISTKVHGIA